MHPFLCLVYVTKENESTSYAIHFSAYCMGSHLGNFLDGRSGVCTGALEAFASFPVR